MDRVLELKFEVLVGSSEDIYKVLDDSFFALNKVRRIIEVDTADVKDLGLFEDEITEKYEPKPSKMITNATNPGYLGQ